MQQIAQLQSLSDSMTNDCVCVYHIVLDNEILFLVVFSSKKPLVNLFNRVIMSSCVNYERFCRSSVQTFDDHTPRVSSPSRSKTILKTKRSFSKTSPWEGTVANPSDSVHGVAVVSASGTGKSTAVKFLISELCWCRWKRVLGKPKRGDQCWQWEVACGTFVHLLKFSGPEEVRHDRHSGGQEGAISVSKAKGILCKVSQGQTDPVQLRRPLRELSLRGYYCEAVHWWCILWRQQALPKFSCSRRRMPSLNTLAWTSSALPKRSMATPKLLRDSQIWILMLAIAASPATSCASIQRTEPRCPLPSVSNSGSSSSANMSQLQLVCEPPTLVS